MRFAAVHESGFGTSRWNGQLDFMSGFGGVRKQVDVAALPVPTRMPSRPGEFHPEPLTEPDLSLSTYPARATA